MTAVPPPPPAGNAPVPASGGTNGLAITSMILGIVSIFTCLYAILAIPLGLGAIITGVLGKKNAAEKGGNGLALTGIITGAIGLLLAIIFVVVVVFAGDGSNEWLCEYDASYC